MEIAAHSAYDMSSKLHDCPFGFYHLGVWKLSLIAPFPDHCLLLPFSNIFTLILITIKTCRLLYQPGLLSLFSTMN